jgi:signal peptidase II
LGRAFPAALALVVVGLDQVAKAAVVDALGPDADRHRVDLLGSFLALHYVENAGAAFGVLRGQGVVVTVLALVVLGGLVVYYRRTGAAGLWAGASLGLLVGGAVGNLIDRARLGYVVDFVAVGPWPKFNLADSAITVGVLLLAAHGLAGPRPSAVGRQPSGRGTVGEASAVHPRADG